VKFILESDACFISPGKKLILQNTGIEAYNLPVGKNAVEDIVCQVTQQIVVNRILGLLNGAGSGKIIVSAGRIIFRLIFFSFIDIYFYTYCKPVAGRLLLRDGSRRKTVIGDLTGNFPIGI